MEKVLCPQCQSDKIWSMGASDDEGNPPHAYYCDDCHHRFESEVSLFKPAYNGLVHQGCLHAPAVQKIAPMDLFIGVGFGVAMVTCNDEVIFRENFDEDDNWHYLREFEEMAQNKPGDWIVTLYAPLRGEVYQRQGKEKWVLIDSNPGFA